MEKNTKVFREAVIQYMNDNNISVMNKMAEVLGMTRTTFGSWMGGVDGTCQSASISDSKLAEKMKTLADLSEGKTTESNKGRNAINSTEFVKEFSVNDLASQILSLIPKLEFVLSNNFTGKDREKVRSRAIDDGVFKASVLISQLCSERARSEVRKRMGGRDD